MCPYSGFAEIRFALPELRIYRKIPDRGYMRYLRGDVVLIVGFVFLIPGLVFARQLNPVEARGMVDRIEIGGDDLKVSSIWDVRKFSSVGQDGAFVTMVSNLRPQKLSVVDGRNMTRALAISLPEYPDKIIFDANSTACAILFKDPSAFGQTRDVEDFRKVVISKQSFRRLESFLRENLPTRPLEDIVKDSEFTVIMDNCAKEIFNEDKESINGALQAAQSALQKSLQSP